MPPLFRDVRAQYFLTFAALGTVLPYASVFFRQAGLTQGEIGLAFAMWSGAQVLSPVLVAWAADARLDPRRLVFACAAGTAVALLGLGFVRGVGPVLAVWAAYCLASLPLLPLADGCYFSLRQRDAERGLATAPYHRVRVWGTVGFIVPSVGLYWLLDAGRPVTDALTTGAAVAVLAAAQAVLLDDPRPAAPTGGRPGPGLPTAAAARMLFRPPLLVFCAALFLAQMASSAYAAFYPVYLTERAGIAAKWVGLIAQAGVVAEVFVVLGCGYLVGRFGVRGMLVGGMALVAVRFGLLAASAAVPVAVGTQLFHGLQVVVTSVMPQAFLDRHADDDCRHSMQGVFVMLMGVGKMAGSLAAGQVAAVSLQAVFGWGATLCLAAVGLAVVAFREGLREPGRATAPVPAA
ncbi:MAG: major facilitator superfamily 1 [Phycisphaerales bacterium]|nr:major facilitator superfamily 1 [Phycisphaerales bacterium]